MIGRRGLLLAGGGLPAAAQTAVPAVHALLVGIDNYRLSPLRGAINDLRLLERALRPLATSVSTLVDRQASRAAFLATWQDVAARCQRGDWLVFTFSGHGDRKPEAIAGSEADGLDDFIVFQPFHPREAPQEILLDNEIEVMLAEQARRGVRVLMVADCCHAGTLTRAVHVASRGQLRLRTMAGSYAMEDLTESLRSAPPPPAPPPREALSQVAFFAGSVETLPVPEIYFEGRPHGALSVAIARALGRAAQGEPPTLRAVADQVVRSVRALGDGRQSPEVTLPPGDATLFGLRTVSAPPPTALPPPAPLEVRLRTDGADAASIEAVSRLPDVRRVTAAEEADLIWLPSHRQMVSAMGDLLSDGIGPAELPASVARLRAIRRLQQLVTEQGLEVRLERQGVQTRGISRPSAVRAHNDAHPAGTRLRLTVEGLRLPHLVMFSVAGDGTVQFLLPRATDPAQVDIRRPLVLESLEAGQPFGADHVVALALPTRDVTLLNALARLDERREPMQAVAAVERALAAGTWQIGLVAIFTRAA